MSRSHMPPVDTTRSLLSLLGALSRDGDTLDVQSVATRFGISEQQANDLLDLLLTAGNDEGSLRLPLAYEDDGSLVFVSSLAQPTRGRPLRLTPSEAQALTAAFDVVGLTQTDELRTAVEQAFYPLTAEHIQSSSVSDLDDEPTELLVSLAQAILAEVPLEFDYRPLVGDTLSRRHAKPLALRHERQHWYLDAFDLDRGAHRSFRVDRMGDPVTTDSSHAEQRRQQQVEPKRVTLTISQPELLDILDWPNLTIEAYGHGSVNCTTVWYPNSNWLPRRLAACGSSVRIYDPELAQATRRVAHALLNELT